MTFVSERLRLARHLRGLSLAELGELVAVSRQYLHRLEAAHDAAPTPELLTALADALAVAPEFLARPIDRRVEDTDCHFRQRQTTPLTVREHALAHGRLFVELVSLIDATVALPAVNFPTYDVRTHEDLENAAEDLRQRWGLGVEAPIKNMCRTLERAGAVITTFSGISEKLDAFSWTGDRPVVVRSSTKGSTSRARFDLAHECGHLVMHPGVVTGSAEREAEADAFASSFLMPMRAFAREFPRRARLEWTALFELKKRWGVSLGAMVRRGYDLSIIGPAEYRRAFIYLRKKGWARGGEPHEPPAEEPEVVRLAMKHVRPEQQASARFVCQRLAWTPEMFEAVTGIQVHAEVPDGPNVVDFRSATRRVRPQGSV